MPIKILVTLVSAACLAWGGVSLLGLIAVFVIDHHFFGLPVSWAIWVEEFFAWVPLSLALGFAVGYLCRQGAVLFGLATSVVSMLGLLLSGLSVWQEAGFTTAESVKAGLLILTSPGLLTAVFLPAGAYLGSNFARPNPSFNGTPGGAR